MKFCLVKAKLQGLEVGLGKDNVVHTVPTIEFRHYLFVAVCKMWK